jgi:hypothetical protein
MLEQSVYLLSQADTFAVIEFLDQQEDRLNVAGVYDELVRNLYWKEKNVPDMVALARAGIQYCLTAGTAVADEDVELALQLRSKAKTIAYNLASYTWIGWAEPDTNLDETDQQFGLEAAHMNLRMALELDKGDMRISRAHWMIGAQLLAAGDRSLARESFQLASLYASRAEEETDELLARSYLLLVDLLVDPENASLQQAQAEVRRQLAQVEHGQMFVDQLETAWQVFSVPTPNSP